MQREYIRRLHIFRQLRLSNLLFFRFVDICNGCSIGSRELSLMQTFDAIVLGLGTMGSFTCLELARRGLRVAGFDAFSPPHLAAAIPATPACSA